MCEDQQFWQGLPRDFTRQSKLIWKPCHDFQSRLHRRLKPKYVNINNIIKLHGDLLPTFPIITGSLSSLPLADDTQSNQVAHQPETTCLFLRASLYEVPPLLPKSQIHPNTYIPKQLKQTFAQKSHQSHWISLNHIDKDGCWRGSLKGAASACRTGKLNWTEQLPIGAKYSLLVQTDSKKFSWLSSYPAATHW